MTTRENDLLLQFMEMVFPKDLLRYFELTGFREDAVSEKDRFGVESGELIVSLEERDCLRNPIEGHTYRPNGFYEASKVRDFWLSSSSILSSTAAQEKAEDKLTDEAFCFDPLGRRQFKVHPANLLDTNIIQSLLSLIYLSRPPFRPTSWHPTISVKA